MSAPDERLAAFGVASGEELKSRRAGLQPHSPEAVRMDALLETLRREADHEVPLLRSMDERLATLERKANRSEWRTWTLWVALVGVMVGISGCWVSMHSALPVAPFPSAAGASLPHTPSPPLSTPEPPPPATSPPVSLPMPDPDPAAAPGALPPPPE